MLRSACRPRRREACRKPVWRPHAVLQQGKAAPVWGTARPGEKVTVSLGGKTATATVADAQGKWMVHGCPAVKSGGPFVLTIKGR